MPGRVFKPRKFSRDHALEAWLRAASCGELLPPDSCSQEQEPLQFHTTREELEHRSFITSNIIPNSFLSEIRICFGLNNVTSLANVWLIHKVANQITEPSVKSQITRFLTHLFSVFTLP